MLSENEASRLMTDLCVVLGFCLPPKESQRIYSVLISKQRLEARTLADEVFRAEGMDPSMADQHLYRQVRNMISTALDGSATHAG